jgi:hypothetical protein
VPDKDVKTHLERSRRDESVGAKVLAISGDWAIVARFYAAMHVLEAYLLTKNGRFFAKRHDERWRAVKASPELRENFRAAYAQLHDVSEQVRYDPGFTATGDNINQSEVNLRLVHSVLDSKIEKKSK